MILLIGSGNANGALIDSLTTLPSGGLLSGGSWATGDDGFKLKWTISLNNDNETWHYKYEFFETVA